MVRLGGLEPPTKSLGNRPGPDSRLQPVTLKGHGIKWLAHTRVSDTVTEWRLFSSLSVTRVQLEAQGWSQRDGRAAAPSWPKSRQVKHPVARRQAAPMGTAELLGSLGGPSETTYHFGGGNADQRQLELRGDDN